YRSSSGFTCIDYKIPRSGCCSGRNSTCCGSSPTYGSSSSTTGNDCQRPSRHVTHVHKSRTHQNCSGNSSQRNSNGIQKIIDDRNVICGNFHQGRNTQRNHRRPTAYPLPTLI